MMLTHIYQQQCPESNLDVLFHQAMHQWDDGMIPLLQQDCATLRWNLPRDLFHALIF